MMNTEEIEKILIQKLAGAEVSVQDMTGTMDHFEISAVWEGFRGKGLIAQHKVIQEALRDELESGRIHALKIKTRTP